VRNHGYNGVDGDWDLVVLPDPAYEHLLVNPAGERNASGTLTCEIEPTEPIVRALAKGPQSRADVEADFFGPLKDKPVRIVGTWSVDRSHFANGKTPGRPAPKRGKMEIHPITSIFAVLSEPGAAIKRVAFFVFSNQSRRIAFPVPHNGEARTGRFQTPFPTAGAGDQFRFRLVREENHAASVNYEVLLLPNGTRALRGTVNAGSSRDGQGFYHAIIERWYR